MHLIQEHLESGNMVRVSPSLFGIHRYRFAKSWCKYSKHETMSPLPFYTLKLGCLSTQSSSSDLTGKFTQGLSI